MELAHSHATSSKATASGDAWETAKAMLDHAPNGYVYKDGKRWKTYFPSLPLDLDMRLRRAYMGGLNISRHRGLNVATEDVPIVHEDLHSSYPARLHDYPLPVGRPVMSGLPPCDGVLYIAEVRVRFKVKEGMFPWFQFKNGLDCMLEGIEPGTPVEECKEWHELTLTSIDLELLARWYDLEIDDDYPAVFFIFTSATGVFADYVDRFFREKEEAGARGDKLSRTLAKLKLNSLYGRFGLNVSSSESNELVFDEELGDWNWESSPEDPDNDIDCYVPMAIFCTAWARYALLDGCERVGPENVIHCDTDSIIHFGAEVDDMDHRDILGAWGIESRPLSVREAGFKRYFEVLKPLEDFDATKDKIDDYISIGCAGVPQKYYKDTRAPRGMWLEILDNPDVIYQEGYELGQAHYVIKSKWLRELYEFYGLDPDDVDTLKHIPVRCTGGSIFKDRTHKLNDNLFWRLRR